MLDFQISSKTGWALAPKPNQSAEIFQKNQWWQNRECQNYDSNERLKQI